MAVLDFLFQGSAPPSTTTYGTSTQNLPTWYSDYTQGLINKANAIAAEPYQRFGGERLAGFTPQQEQAFGMAGTAGGAYKPFLDTAQNYATTAGGTATLPQVQNLLNRAGSLDPYAEAGGALGLSQGLINQATQAPTGYTMGGGNLAQASGITSDIGTGAMGSGLGTANTYGLQGAGNQAITGMQPYEAKYANILNPDLSALAKNQYNQLLQNVNDKFIGSGGFGGSRMGQALGAGAAQIAGNVANQQAGLAQQGLQQLGSLAQSDLARQLQVAQAAGALGQTDLSRQLQAAGQLGTLGTQAGQLQQADVAQKLAQAGQQAQLGAQQGQLAGQTQTNLGNLAQTQAGIQQADLQRQLDAASKLGTLGTSASQLGLQQAAALESAGQTQQNQAQKALDIAYQNFQAQRQYPQEMISFLNNTIRGLQIPTSTSTTQTGPASTYQASPLSQIASAGATAAGLGKLFGG